MADPQTTKFSKEEMLKWLDELIELEKGSDACFPNIKWDTYTIAKDIREVVANAKI